MDQFISVWRSLGLRRQVIVAVATMAMFAAVITLGKFATRPSMALLYSGLDAKQSGEVLAALDQNSAAYDVRGSAIYVDAARRDELRMSLAAGGLPSNSGAGYELLDTLSGFGTTSQMFDAAYLRAREGELARTIMALPVVRNARVHIADSTSRGLRGASRPSASVVVTTKAALSAGQARALRYLVASAVPGMAPQDVSIIDSENGLVEDSSASAAAGDDQRGEALRQNVERLVAARVGFGKAVVEVAVESVTEREAITEHRLDPEGRVAISTDTQETANKSSDSAATSVTVASNLPTGNAAGGDGASQSSNTESRERTNFEVSETTRELLRVPGAIRRLTVAVLVDGAVDPAKPEVKIPRSDEELAALRDLVAAAVGFDEKRGDVITVKSMDFQPMMSADAVDNGLTLADLSIDLMSVIQLAVLALVSLILGLFVLRPILLSRPQPRPPLLSAPPSPGMALTGIIEDEGPKNGLPALAGARDTAPAPAAREVPADPVARLRDLISERQDETVEILRGWMEETGEKTA